MEFTNYFVIYDPTQDKQPALDRAILIAGEADINLHVFACIYSDVPKSSEKLTAQRSLIKHQQDVLQDMVAPLLRPVGKCSQRLMCATAMSATRI